MWHGKSPQTQSQNPSAIRVTAYKPKANIYPVKLGSRLVVCDGIINRDASLELTCTNRSHSACGQKPECVTSPQILPVEAESDLPDGSSHRTVCEISRPAIHARSRDENPAAVQGVHARVCLCVAATSCS